MELQLKYILASDLKRVSSNSLTPRYGHGIFRHTFRMLNFAYSRKTSGSHMLSTICVEKEALH